MLKAFFVHWRLYLIEAWALGMFMVAAVFIVVLLYHPFFSFNAAIESPMVKRFLVGLGMGLTAICLINSGWGKASGAHMNPAVTLAQFQLGRLSWADTVWYILFQTIGAAVPMLLGRYFFNTYLSYPLVDYIITKPSSEGVWVAFCAEAALSFILLTTLLFLSNTRLSQYTGLIAGLLVCSFITLEAPLSGMSINPARSFGSAIAANQWQAFWLYILAPVGGMQLAALFFRMVAVPQSVSLTGQK
jgi:aquaporin Z